MNAIAPNQTPFPSALPNSPFFSPFLQVPNGEILDIQAVPENTGVFDAISGQAHTPQGTRNMLAEYRANFPYVAVEAFPTFFKTVLLAEGKAKDIEIPQGVVTVRFKGSASYFMSHRGNAQLPTDDESDSLFMPDHAIFYVGNIRSISVIAPNSGTVVSVYGHRFTELPR